VELGKALCNQLLPRLAAAMPRATSTAGLLQGCPIRVSRAGSAFGHRFRRLLFQWRPHDAIFELAVQRFALDPARTLFIDDHAGNVQAARRLGWQALQFVDAAQCEQAVQDAGWL
jgi:beta-phosphoglucomutase-like phosphatase (HAD superfamily)